MNIREVFDPAREIDRRIEKVIQYDAADAAMLKREVGEYVVTDNMVRTLDRLLDAVDTGMSEGSNEIGVWVSGFYGSGKSSLTKYLGFALDEDKLIDGRPFLAYLQDRIADTPLRQRLATVATRHRPAVIMLDLASSSIAGASMAEISTVLYVSVMQWAGYARDRKVAYLEFMLERDGKLDAFKEQVAKLAGGISWEEVKNQPLVANQLASRLASTFYPAIYPDSRAFQDQKLDEAVKTDDEARDMIDLARRRSRRDKIIFVLDEVGQYISAKDSLILNLDGLAKNLKQIGGGKVWLIATAQQTLTEDDPRAQVNTPKLFKLKDRFPIQVDLEASDIREICYRRLLGKSPDGERTLGELYDRHGQQLRFNTQLQNTRYYKKDLDRAAFVNLYPYLPQHFDILLELLGRLAKSSGGVGLRSAIKVIQDVLVAGESADGPLADRPLGTLATAVTFYDTLRRDIHRSFRHVVEGVDRAIRSFGADSDEARVAKTVAVLQVLDDFPVSRENVAALLHPSVDAAGQLESVKAAVGRLIDEESVPLAETAEGLRFMSEAVSEIETERRSMQPIQADRARIVNELLREMFTPLPRASLAGTRAVQCGIKAQGAGGPVSIAGDKEEVQMLVELCPAAGFEALKSERITDSTQPANAAVVYLLGAEPARFRDDIEEIYRCDRIFSEYRNRSVEREVSDYLAGQQQRARSLRGELSSRLRAGMRQGAFVFRGRPQAVATLGGDLDDAARKLLEAVAEEVFAKYQEAPVQADAALAERFLNTEKLDRIESRNDPLGLVQSNGSIHVAHPALRSVLDHLHQVGREEGRALLDHFSRAPYGWSKDTLRYLVAALLIGGEIKLRVSGEDITVRGPTALAALKINAAFNRVGVAPREGALDQAALLRAAERLLELTGEQVLPMEDEVSKVVMRHFPDFQREYAHLVSELRNLGLEGVDRAERIQDGLSEILKGDASDAAARLGPEECALHEDLLWARQVATALAGGLPDVARRARRLLREIGRLPEAGALAALKQDVAAGLASVEAILRRADFFTHEADLQTAVSGIEHRVEQAATALAAEYQADLEAHKAALEARPQWRAIGGDEQERIAAELDALAIAVPANLDGIRECLNARYPLQQRVAELGLRLTRLAQEREDAKREQSGDSGRGVEEGEVLFVEDFTFPAEVGSGVELDAIIERLQELRGLFGQYARIVFGTREG